MTAHVTFQELRDRVKAICDIENDAHISSTELDRIINSAVKETWDVIVNCGQAEKYVTFSTIQIVPGQLTYELRDAVAGSPIPGWNEGDTDTYFYRMHQVYCVESQDQRRSLPRVNPSEIQRYRAPISSSQVLLYYITTAKPLVAADDIFDGINGWEEHTIMTAACAVKLKKEDSYSVFYQRKQELEKRIRNLGNVDFGEPIRVSQKRKTRQDPWLMYANNIQAYGIRGDKIEFYYDVGYIPGI